MNSDDLGLDELYRARFSDAEIRAKRGIWREIGRSLQRWVDPIQPVLDIATDEGYFIANISGSERWATGCTTCVQSFPTYIHFFHILLILILYYT